MAVAVLTPHNAMDPGPQVLMPPALAAPGGFFAPGKLEMQYFQQQAPGPPARSNETRSSKRKWKGGQGRGQGRRPGRSATGGGQLHPTLSTLQRANAKKARRHFQQQRPPMETPRSVPRAPLNTTDFLITQTGQQTPTKVQRPGGLAADREVENLDFFGTNDGLLLRQDARAGAWSDDGLSSDGSDSEGDDPEAVGGEAGAAARPQRDQLAYIMSLEQENMHLRQQNLDYREKMELLEERLRDMEEQQRLAQLEEGEISEPLMEAAVAAAEDATATDAQTATCSSWEDDP